MESARRLSAVLFADIAGYSAVMQKDEKRAMEILSRYQEVLNVSVEQHGGKLIKSYGDGSLCTFSSAVDAVNCAIELQEKFSVAPQVPLRIGIHLGDTITKDNDVYGDAVNIASRLESLGIAGNILVSENIYQHVKNQANLSFSTLGKFRLKNIERPIEVFAIANTGHVVPERKQLNYIGKAKSTWVGIAKWTIPIIILLLSILYFQYVDRNNTEKGIGDGKQGKEQIAVEIFTNNTTNSELAIIGKMASDWISHSITENQVAPVISYESIDQYKNIASAGFSLGDISGIGESTVILVRGNYFLKDSILLFQSSIWDEKENRAIVAFETVRCPIDNPLEGIEKVKEQVLGYWQSKDNFFISQKAPGYTAYQDYLKAKDVWSKDYSLADSMLRRSIQADPNFLNAKFLLAHLYYNLGDYNTLDSLVTELETEFNIKNPVQANVLNYLRALLNGNNKRIFETYQNEYATAPHDLFKNTAMMVVATDFANRPDITIATFEEINDEILDYGNCYYCLVRLEMLARALLMMDRSKEVISLLEPVLELTSKRGPYDYLVKAYLRTGKIEKLDALLQSASDSNLSSNANYLYFLSAYDAKLLGEKDLQLKYANKAIDLYKPADGSFSKMQGRSYLLAEDFQNAKKVFNGFLLKEPEDIFSMSKLASIAFTEEETSKALEYINTMEESIHSWDFGYTYYFIGQAYAEGGKVEQALNYLKKARQSGDRLSNIDYNFDPSLSSLHSLSEWKEVLDGE